MEKKAKLQIAAGILHLIAAAGIIFFGVSLITTIRNFDFGSLYGLFVFLLPGIAAGYVLGAIIIVIGAAMTIPVILVFIPEKEDYDSKTGTRESLVRLDRFVIALFVVVLITTCLISRAFTLMVGVLGSTIIILAVSMGILIAIND